MAQYFQCIDFRIWFDVQNAKWIVYLYPSMINEYAFLMVYCLFTLTISPLRSVSVPLNPSISSIYYAFQHWSISDLFSVHLRYNTQRVMTSNTIFIAHILPMFLYRLLSLSLNFSLFVS